MTKALRMSNNSILSLPYCVMLVIFDMMDDEPENLLRCMRVCKYWRDSLLKRRERLEVQVVCMFFEEVVPRGPAVHEAEYLEFEEFLGRSVKPHKACGILSVPEKKRVNLVYQLQ